MRALNYLLLPLFLSALYAAAVAEEPATGAAVKALIRQLSGDDFDARQTAMTSLKAMGDTIAPDLYRALDETQDAETRTRLTDLLTEWRTGSMAWEFEAGYVFGIPCVVDRRVYVANKDNNFFCLDAESGKQIWKTDIGGLMFAFPVVAGGRVYTIRTRKDGKKDGTLFCLDAEKGRTQWTYKFDSQNFTAPMIDDGRLFIACEDTLWCKSAADGKDLWKFTTDDMLLSAPSISGGRLVVGGLEKKLFCLDVKSGVKLWEFETANTITGGAAISEDKVYLTSQDSHIYCLNLSDGKKNWEFAVSGRIYASPAVAGGRVYTGGDDGMFYCLNAADGAKLWEFQTGGTIFGSPAVNCGQVFVSAINNKLTLYCLDADNAHKLWTFETKEAGYAYPVFYGRKLFFGYHSKFFVLRTGLSGPQSWPMMCGNAARTGCNDRPPDTLAP